MNQISWPESFRDVGIMICACVCIVLMFKNAMKWGKN